MAGIFHSHEPRETTSLNWRQGQALRGATWSDIATPHGSVTNCSLTKIQLSIRAQYRLTSWLKGNAQTMAVVLTLWHSTRSKKVSDKETQKRKKVRVQRKRISELCGLMFERRQAQDILHHSFSYSGLNIPSLEIPVISINTSFTYAIDPYFTSLPSLCCHCIRYTHFNLHLGVVRWRRTTWRVFLAYWVTHR